MIYPGQKENQKKKKEDEKKSRANDLRCTAIKTLQVKSCSQTFKSALSF